MRKKHNYAYNMTVPADLAPPYLVMCGFTVYLHMHTNTVHALYGARLMPGSIVCTYIILCVGASSQGVFITLY